MRKLVWIILIMPIYLHAQNVGIGTTSPQAKLQINHRATFGEPSLRLLDSSINSAPLLEFRNQSGNNYWQMAGLVHNTNPAQSGFYIYTNENSNLFSIIGNGNVGINRSSPIAALDVNSNVSHTARFNSASDNMYVSFYEADNYRGYIGSYAAGEGLEDMDFGTGLGTTGKLHLSIGAQPKLTVSGNNVGIGTTNPSYSLDVNGPINLRSNIRLNGATGLVGQVLQSNGTGVAPTWENAAYGSTTRFSVAFGASTEFGFANISLPAYYNLNPSQITITSSGITINKTGLYRFDGMVAHRAVFTSIQTNFLPKSSFNLVFGTRSYSMFAEKLMPLVSGTNFRYANSEKFSIEIHVVAGTVLQLNNYIGTMTPAFDYFTSGWLNGHLISE